MRSFYELLERGEQVELKFCSQGHLKQSRRHGDHGDRSPQNSMNLACFTRIWATFAGRWAMFVVVPLQISQSPSIEFLLALGLA